MTETIGKRYRISSVLLYGLDVGTLQIDKKGNKYWKIITSSGATRETAYEYYKIVSEW